MMKFVNGWKSSNKQVDRFHVLFRFGIVTVFEFYYDLSDNKLRFGVFNLFVEK